jgi:hypothetical protein
MTTPPIMTQSRRVERLNRDYSPSPRWGEGWGKGKFQICLARFFTEKLSVQDVNKKRSNALDIAPLFVLEV